MIRMKRLFLLLLLCGSVAHAAAPAASVAPVAPLPQWDIVPAESSISFTGTQNGAPVTGSFKSFTGTIQADPAKYQNSTIDFVIQMNSISVAYAELATILVTPEWFNIKAFPKAEFKSTSFKKINGKTYEATGVLTIKNKAVPTTLTFTAVESPKNHVVVEGSTSIKRSAFGIGEGEWASTDVIKDDVTVNFKIAAVRKK